MKNIKLHYGKILQRFSIPTCYECDIFADELWICDTCGEKVCADCVIPLNESEFECKSCCNKRFM